MLDNLLALSSSSSYELKYTLGFFIDWSRLEPFWLALRLFYVLLRGTLAESMLEFAKLYSFEDFFLVLVSFLRSIYYSTSAIVR